MLTAGYAYEAVALVGRALERLLANSSNSSAAAVSSSTLLEAIHGTPGFRGVVSTQVGVTPTGESNFSYFLFNYLNGSWTKVTP